MKALLNLAGRPSPARFVGGSSTGNQRRSGFVTLGAAAMLLLSPDGAFAQSNPTVALSPALAKATLLSGLDSTKEITIQLSLPLSDPKGAQDFVQHVSNPKDPLFRHYISVQEFAARFGGNAEDFAAVKAWAVSKGLIIQHESSARTSLTLRGSVDQWQKLFKTQLNNYKSPTGDEFYSAAVEPTIPNEIVSKIRGVVGLTGGVQKAPLYKVGKVFGENPETSTIHTDTAGGTGPGGTYSPSDLKTAYLIPQFGGLVPQTVAVFEQGGIVKGDITTFEKYYGLPAVPVTVTAVDGSDTKPNDGTIVEVDLDIQTIIGLNPAVKEVQVYAADYQTVPFSVGLVDTFDTVASTGKAQTLSVSYGTDEVVQGNTAIANEGDALTECASAGVTVLVSAGDYGAYGRTGTGTDPATLNAPDPGSQPLVTCVGGTTLFTGLGEQYLGEEVWNDLGIGHGATGGGVSSYWPIPSYQSPTLVTSNGGSSTARNVPDVGAMADPLTGVGVYTKAAGGWTQIGGTSLSAPVWSGYISILNSGLQYLTDLKTPQVGFFNTLLYFAVGGGLFPAGSLYPVLDGSNGNLDLYGTAGYNAGEYYNNCTGLGSLWGPFGYQIVMVSGTDKGAPPPPDRITVTSTATAAKISWPKMKRATGYAVFFTFLVNDAASKNSTFFVTKSNTLEVTGLVPNSPYGVAVAAVNSGGAADSTTAFTTPKQ
jgi:subtilase family serine protease